jgi:hypothetical protein
MDVHNLGPADSSVLRTGTGHYRNAAKSFGANFFSLPFPVGCPGHAIVRNAAGSLRRAEQPAIA